MKGKKILLVVVIAIATIVVLAPFIWTAYLQGNAGDQFNCTDATTQAVNICKALHIPYQIKYGFNPGESEGHVWVETSHLTLDWGIAFSRPKFVVTLDRTDQDLKMYRGYWIEQRN
jgi:hypothetical protein